jgi:acyl-homoserine lactone acylase PvdQ
MGKIKILIYLVVAVVALATGALYLTLRTSFASELRYKGGVIRIERGEHNIPEVHAFSLESALYGWGYTLGEDRLFQLAFKRATIKGELSRYFGARTVEVDKMFREINLHGWAQLSAKRVPIFLLSTKRRMLLSTTYSRPTPMGLTTLTTRWRSARSISS